MRRNVLWSAPPLVGCALLTLLAVLQSATAAPVASADPNVLTQHNDVSRTGATLSETELNTTTVSVHTFGRLFRRVVDGQIFAQPLYVAHLALPRHGTHNVVFVATMHNSVYAFDADDPAVAAPLWHDRLAPPVMLLDPNLTGPYGPFQDIQDAIGIVSTPVIDLRSQTLYVVTASRANAVYSHALHALDLTTGREKDGGPVAIQASVPIPTGRLLFNDLRQLQRPGLLLSRGVVYVAFGSYADADPFHGWLLGYDAHTLRQVFVFTDTPHGSEGGIWQSGQGPAADATGHVYVMTGNGSWDGVTNFGNSVVKLSLERHGPVVTDWFTPSNQASLNPLDLDLGSGGPVLLPGTHLLVGGSKQGVLYVLDQRHLGHYYAGADRQIVQEFHATRGPIFGSPVYWAGPRGGTLFVWSGNDYLRAYRLRDARFQTTPIAQSPLTLTTPLTMPAGVLALSANGSTAGSGIVWAVQPSTRPDITGSAPAILRAFDASNVRRELWDSMQDPARDAVGGYAKFNAPTIANGKVYVGTSTGYLDVYGLLSQSQG